jgi:hypothetical protein
MPTDDSSRFLHAESAKWRDVITKAGIPAINENSRKAAVTLSL